MLDNNSHLSNGRVQQNHVSLHRLPDLMGAGTENLYFWLHLKDAGLWVRADSGRITNAAGHKDGAGIPSFSRAHCLG